MANGQLSGVMRRLQKAFLRDEARPTDGRLLEDYVKGGDPLALAALVRRHGPMVWGVCRRVLGNYHDAEDAFQATFLVLVRRAASIAAPESLANWLYGVGRLTALKARGSAIRRKMREKHGPDLPEPAVAEHNLWNDLRPLLDEELGRLPDIFRVVIVLCDLEGTTRKEAARRLGLPEGTVGSRLARARVMLAKRLARRGVTLSGGALAAALAQNMASAGVPDTLMSSTISAATSFAAGQAAATGLISGKAAALAEGVLKAMMTSKLKAVFALVLVVGLLGWGGGVVMRQSQATAHHAMPLVELPEEQPPPDLSGTWRGDGWGTVVLRPTKKGAFAGTYTDTFGKDVGRIAVQWAPASRRYEGTWSEGTFRFGRLALEAAGDGASITGAYTTDPKCEHEPGVPSLASLRWNRVKSSAVESDEIKSRPSPAAASVTAWGKEVGGLQAGLGFRAGGKGTYRHGETLILVIRVRNVGKETVKFSYLMPYIEHEPIVTDGAGKRIPQPTEARLYEIGERLPGQVELGPGKEIELHELKRELKPASESDSMRSRPEGRPHAFYGTGKVGVEYEHVFGNPAIGHPGWKLDSTLSELATGKLDLDIKSDPSAAPGKETLPKKDGEDGHLKPIKIRVYIEKVNMDTATITASCMLIGEYDGVTKPVRFENLRVSEKAKITDRGKELKLADVKLLPRDTHFYLFLRTYEEEFGFEVVGIETIPK